MFFRKRIPHDAIAYERNQRAPDAQPPVPPTLPMREALDRAWAQGYDAGYRDGQSAGTLRAWAWGLWK